MVQVCLHKCFDIGRAGLYEHKSHAKKAPVLIRACTGTGDRGLFSIGRRLREREGVQLSVFIPVGACAGRKEVYYEFQNYILDYPHACVFL